MKKNIIIGILLVLTGLSFFLKLRPPPAPAEGDVIAIFDGGQIKVSEVMETVNIDPDVSVEAALSTKLLATIQLVKRRLLELEGADRGISPEEVSAQAAKESPAVADDEVNVYLSNTGKNPKTATKKDFETARTLVRNHKIMNAGTKYLDDLYKKRNVRLHIDR